MLMRRIIGPSQQTRARNNAAMKSKVLHTHRLMLAVESADRSSWILPVGERKDKNETK